MATSFGYGGKAKKICYLLNEDTNEILEAQFVPERIPHSRGVTYANIESPGMAYPSTQFVHGNVRTFDIPLFFYDRPYTGKILNVRNFIGKLLPPEYNTTEFIRPPVFTFGWGYFVRRLVLESLDIDDRILTNDGLPMVSYFDLHVRQVGIIKTW